MSTTNLPLTWTIFQRNPVLERDVEAVHPREIDRLTMREVNAWLREHPDADVAVCLNDDDNGAEVLLFERDENGQLSCTYGHPKGITLSDLIAAVTS